MLTPKHVMINITRAMGVVLIALIVNEIVKRQPWCEGYTGITAFFICGSIILAAVGVYLIIKGNSVAEAAIINVNQGFDQFSLATIVVITVKTLGITIMVLMGGQLCWIH